MQIKLAVASLGMITPLGQGVVHSAAAHRAGLNLARAVPGFSVEGGTDDEDDLVRPLSGHRISPLTDGFLQTGLWIRIGIAALRDLIAYSELPPPTDTAFWRRTALFVVVPDVSHDRFAWPADEIKDLVAGKYVDPLCSLLGLDLAFAPLQIAFGHAGWAAAAQAAKGMIGHAVDRALLLGVDSYVDPLSLTVLGASERIKTPNTPTGLIPGEAGACFLLERSNPQRGRCQGSLVAARHGMTPVNPPGEQDDVTPFVTAVGRQLADAVVGVLADAAAPAPFTGDILLDLNGEEWRSRAWAAAQLRLQSHVNWDRCDLVLPCASFGEIGAASGPVAVALAVRAFARGYARSEQTMVLSVSEDGDVGAALVARS